MRHPSATTRIPAKFAVSTGSAVFPGGGGSGYRPAGSGAEGVAATTMLASRVQGEGAGDGSELSAALDVVDKLAESQNTGARFRLVAKNPEMENALSTLIASNPTAAPGRWDSEEKTARLANGQWRVLYAPHMFVLQQVRFHRAVSIKSFHESKKLVSSQHHSVNDKVAVRQLHAIVRQLHAAALLAGTSSSARRAAG
jgi:hypothetical protein